MVQSSAGKTVRRSGGEIVLSTHALVLRNSGRTTAAPPLDEDGHFVLDVRAIGPQDPCHAAHDAVVAAPNQIDRCGIVELIEF
jgi:hypothetical protein